MWPLLAEEYFKTEYNSWITSMWTYIFFWPPVLVNVLTAENTFLHVVILKT